MPVEIDPVPGTSKYTTKNHISFYSAVPENDINDYILTNTDGWVDQKLKGLGIDPDTIVLPHNNLTMAACFYGVFLLSRAGGGKAFKINMMEHNSSSVGEISESLNSPQYADDEKPSTDWYGLAQRELNDFKADMIDNNTMSIKKYTAKSASTTDYVPSPFKRTGKEEYPASSRFRTHRY
jgi:hypothetical protein